MGRTLVIVVFAFVRITLKAELWGSRSLTTRVNWHEKRAVDSVGFVDSVSEETGVALGDQFTHHVSSGILIRDYSVRKYRVSV